MSVTAWPTDGPSASPTPSPTDWQAGWWPAAQRRPSPNFGPRPPGMAVSLVVLHAISLPPGEYGGDAVERFFANTLDWDAHPWFDSIRGLEVSAHFFLRRDGQLLQHVSCDDRAWHAGRSHWQGRDGCNDFAIGIELEGLDGQPFEPAQYAQLIPLLRALRQRYPIDAVVGHEHIAPGRKTDPGPGFDWLGVQQALGWADVGFPTGVEPSPGCATHPPTDPLPHAPNP